MNKTESYKLKKVNVPFYFFIFLFFLFIEEKVNMLENSVHRYKEVTHKKQIRCSKEICKLGTVKYIGDAVYKSFC